MFFPSTVLATEPFHRFKLPISTEEFNDDEENGLKCHLVFTYTEKYPDTSPLVEIEDAINFEDTYSKRLIDHINETVRIFVIGDCASRDPCMQT